MRSRRRVETQRWVTVIISVVGILVSISGIVIGQWRSTPIHRRSMTEQLATGTVVATPAAPAVVAQPRQTVSVTQQAELPTAIPITPVRITPVLQATPTAVTPLLAAAATVLRPTVAAAITQPQTAGVIAEVAAPVTAEQALAPPLDLATALGETRALPAPLLFVSRQITSKGTVYAPAAKGMPGVGPYSRFEVAAPGRLLILQPNGTVNLLIDGAAPTVTTYNLIDVSAPALSYDGTQIVFAGLPQGAYPSGPMQNPGAWRLYLINVDGSGLRQLTFSDQEQLDRSQFGDLAATFAQYDDTDPAWLPDGRIVFASTRYPSFGQYGAARTTNLFVVNADGSALHRITTERNGADRPLVDPVTGRIVYSRWWRNFRVPVNSMETQLSTTHEGYRQQGGLLAETDATADDPIPGGTANVSRNAWQLGTVNPDGTGLRLFAGASELFQSGEDINHAYGGAFTGDGLLYANYFPMRNLTEAAGFGGIRRYQRGANGYTPIIGVTADDQYPPVISEPPSIGVMQSAYAADPAVLPDGRLVIAWAPDMGQDYGLYMINADGSNRIRLFDQPGASELRAQVVMARPQPPIIPDQVTITASPLPPLADGPYDQDGEFTFQALNVYFNGPVDSEIINGIPVGQAATIRFYTDYQRQQPGSLDWVDWPILLQELPITPNGTVITRLPANVPLFEQIRTAQPSYSVPLTGRASSNKPGVAHVLGLNFGHPGETATCVGCHAGHSLLEVPTNPDDAAWSNLAPGATVTASSVHPTLNGNLEGLIDRRVQKGAVTAYWRSDPMQNPGAQWVQFTFPVPVTVRTVRLYNPRPDLMGTITVESTAVYLYRDEAATQEVASAETGALAVSGTAVAFQDVTSRVVRVEITGVSGAFNNELVASLAEVEIIARAEAPE